MKTHRTRGSSLNLASCVLIIAAVGLGCMGMRRPWRDYSDKPFNSAEWLAGDAIDRGRMMHDLSDKLRHSGKERDAMTGMLGKPDLTRTIEKKEVWFYRVDIGIAGGMDLIPISFDEKGGGTYGMAKGGTFSIMAKEDEL